MKNKVLATLISACLFMGLAVPAFAITTSTQSGQNSEIKTGEFLKTEYTLKNGAKSKKMAAELRAYVSTKQLTQNPDVDWSIENDDKFAFSISEEGFVEAVEDSGTATIIARMNDGTVLAKTKIKAEPKLKQVFATGFVFENSTETMLIGAEAALKANNGRQDIVIKPSPADSKFTNAQIDAIEDQIDTGVMSITAEGITVTPSVVTSEDKIIVRYAGATMTYADTTVKVTDTGNEGDTIKFGGLTLKTSKAAAADGDAWVKAFVSAWNSDSNTHKVKYNIVRTDNAEFQIKNTVFSPDKGVIKANGADFEVTKATGGAKTFALTNSALGAIDFGTSVFAIMAEEKFDKQVLELAVLFPRPNDDLKTSNIKRSLNVYGKKAKAANSVNAAATKVIAVGEKINVEKLFKQGPSNANVTFDVVYTYDYIDQNVVYSDYAIVLDSDDSVYTDAGDILGVAVGRNKIVATTKTPYGTKTASFIVEVKEKGSTTPTTPEEGTASLSFSTANPSVGGAGFTLTVKNAPEGAAITFRSLDEKIATVDASGKVTAISVGTTQIEVNVNGQKLYCTVTTKAATATAPGGSTGTEVPKTNVTVLAPLF